MCWRNGERIMNGKSAWLPFAIRHNRTGARVMANLTIDVPDDL